MSASSVNNFFKGIFLGIGGMGFRTALNILIMPMIIQYLGIEQYGFYILLLSLIDMLILIDAGLNSGLVNRLSVYGGQGDDVRVKEQLSMGFWLYLAMSILMYIVGYQFLPNMSTWFNLSPQLQALSVPAHHIILITGALSLFGNYYQSMVLANHRYHWVQIADLFYQVGSNVAAVILLINGYGILEVLTARLALLIIRVFYLVWCSYQVEPFGLFPPMQFKMQAFKELFSVSMFSLLLGVSAIFAMRIDNMVIAANLTMVDVAIFGIVFRLYNMVSEVVDKLTSGIMPLASKYFAEGNEGFCKVLFGRGTSFIHFVTMILLIWVTYNYAPIFKYFSHNEIPIEKTYQLMWVAMLVVWNHCIARPATGYLFVFNHRFIMIGSSILATIANVALSLWLVHPLGIVGVALGTLIPSTLEHHAALIWYSCRQLKIPVWRFVWDTYGKTLPSLLVCGGTLWGLSLIPYTSGSMYIDMFLSGSIAFLVSSVALFFTSVTPKERELFLNKLSTFTVKFGLNAKPSTSPIANTQESAS